MGRAFPNLVAGQGGVSTSTFSAVHFNSNVIKDRLPSGDERVFSCAPGASQVSDLCGDHVKEAVQHKLGVWVFCRHEKAADADRKPRHIA
jgi:hypothetical protein